MQPDLAYLFASPGSVVSTAASESDVRFRAMAAALAETREQSSSWHKRLWCLTISGALLAGALIGLSIGWAAPVLWPRGGPSACTSRTSCGRLDSCLRFQLYGRDIWVYRPLTAKLAPMSSLPVVIALHGSGDCALGLAARSGFQAVAEEAQLLVVYPEMASPETEDWGYNDPREVSFFNGMVEMLGYEFLVDPKAVYVCGHASGGTMALFLQNKYPGIFRAAAAVEAGVADLDQWDNSSFGRPVAVVWNHNDQVLQDYGGRGLFRRTLQQLLRTEPGQHDAPAEVTPLCGPSSGPASGDVLYANRLQWDAQGRRPPVMVVSWASAEPTHAWPSSTACFDAARVIWAFFVHTRSYQWMTRVA